MKSCNCPLCKEADYNPEEFYVNINDFDREHKNGVSGLMRVKDEQQTIAASIDSCIDALDELIICYQKCSDSTPEIIEQKRLQYPDKIKVYFYAPRTYNNNLSPQEYEYAMNLPDDSIHLLSNYYNYTQSKATYKYALKIDADQIYFTERLKDICNAYRTDKKYKTTFAERMAFRYGRKSRAGISMKHISLLKNKITILLSRKTCFELYYSALLKTIANNKYYTSFPGINISNKNGELGVPYKNTEGDKVFSLNGVDDHIVYEISKNTYYFPYRDFVTDIPSERGTIFIEGFIIDKYPLLQAPFMWHHLRYYINKGIKSTSFNQIPYDEFRTSTLKMLKKSNKIHIMSHMIRIMWFMYKYDRRHPDFRQEQQKYGL